MPLTPEETDFLAHLAFEYTNILPGPDSKSSLPTRRLTSRFRLWPN